MVNDEDLVKELKDIQLAVTEASENTNRQLQAIDSKLSIEAIIAIFAAFGITYLLQIFIYWIPSAFLLIFLWGIYSIVYTAINKKMRFQKSVDALSEANPSDTSLTMGFMLKNIIPIIKAISVIYGISLIIILASNPPWFNPNHLITYIPIIACLFLLCIPLMMKNLDILSSKEKVEKLIEDAKFFHKNKDDSLLKVIIKGVLGLLAIAYLIFLIILPAISLAITYPTSISFFESFRLIFLILILQIVTMVMLARYFSAQLARKELVNTITNYADIHLICQYHLRNKQITQKDLEQISHLFLTAKQFDTLIIDSMKFYNSYILIPNRVYSRISTIQNSIDSTQKEENP